MARRRPPAPPDEADDELLRMRSRSALYRLLLRLDDMQDPEVWKALKLTTGADMDAAGRVLYELHSLEYPPFNEGPRVER